MAVFLTIEGCLSTTLWIIEWTTELEQDFSHQQYDVGAVIHIPPGHCIWQYVAVWMSSSFSKIYLAKPVDLPYILRSAETAWPRTCLHQASLYPDKGRNIDKYRLSFPRQFASELTIVSLNMIFSHFHVYFSPKFLVQSSLSESTFVTRFSPRVFHRSLLWPKPDGARAKRAARRAAPLMDETWASSQPAKLHPNTLEKTPAKPKIWMVSFCMFFVFFRIPSLEPLV